MSRNPLPIPVEHLLRQRFRQRERELPAWPYNAKDWLDQGLRQKPKKKAKLAVMLKKKRVSNNKYSYKKGKRTVTIRFIPARMRFSHY